MTDSSMGRTGAAGSDGGKLVRTLARRTDTAISYLVGGGLVYLVLWVYGLLGSQTSRANLVPLNTADDWLHFVLGLGMIGMGLLGRQAAARTPPGPAPRAETARSTLRPADLLVRRPD